MENREKNLTLYYEAVRKDLDIVLTSTIPTQKNLMKTIMWVNTSILGFIFTQLKSLPYVEWLIVSIGFSSFAIFLIVYSLKEGQIKYFGHSDLEQLESLESNRTEHIRGIAIMIDTVEQAYNNNIHIVQQRAKKLSGATTFTLFSFLNLSIYAGILANITLH